MYQESKNIFLTILLPSIQQQHREAEITKSKINNEENAYTVVNPPSSAPTAIKHTSRIWPPTAEERHPATPSSLSPLARSSHLPPAALFHGEAARHAAGKGRPPHRLSCRHGGLPPSPHRGEATRRSLTMGSPLPHHFEEGRHQIRPPRAPVGRERDREEGRAPDLALPECRWLVGRGW